MSPFREVEHTADWALEVWSDSLPGLFREAARGMQALAGFSPEGDGSPETRRVDVRAEDIESLLVAWLQELLYMAELEGLAFDEIEIEGISPTALTCVLTCRIAGRPEKAIKAVTYHGLQVIEAERGYEATLVFDV